MTDLHSSNRTVTAFFDTREAADKAVNDLMAKGVARADITVTGGGAATGKAADPKTFWEELKDFFLPDEDRSAYAEGLRRGGYVVYVRTSDVNHDIVVDVLDRDGAVDLDEREATWRSEGWTGFESDDASRTMGAATSTGPGTRTSTQGATSTVAAGKDETIPVYEERLQVGKRDVNRGRVRVRSYVVETPVSEQVSLRREDVRVERRPVDRPVTGRDAAFQDRVIEAEEHVEEAVVGKEARVKEEITLRKSAQEQTKTVNDKVRHTEVEVEDERDRAAGRKPQGFTAAASASIAKRMDVVSSDGATIGTVDHLEGQDRIKLAKSTSPDGKHHFVPFTWIDHVDSHVHLNKTAAEARAAW
jgi:uncharacterized protein (TIGR02271 family)